VPLFRSIQQKSGKLAISILLHKKSDFGRGTLLNSALFILLVVDVLAVIVVLVIVAQFVENGTLVVREGETEIVGTFGLAQSLLS
jgi:hypothetical protein